MEPNHRGTFPLLTVVGLDSVARLNARYGGTACPTPRSSSMTILANILLGADSLLKILTDRERFL